MAKVEKKTLQQFLGGRSSSSSRSTFYPPSSSRPQSSSSSGGGYKKPFPKAPSSSNSGGGGGSSTSNNYNDNRKSGGSNKNSDKFKGEKKEIPSFSFNIKPSTYDKLLRACPQSHREALSGSSLPPNGEISGKIAPFHPKLAKTFARPLHSEHSGRLENTILFQTDSVQPAQTVQSQPGTEKFDLRGSDEHVKERGNSEDSAHARASTQQHFSEGKEGGGKIQTHHKPEGSKQTHPLRKVQDGISEKLKKFIKRGRLHGKNRSKRCLLLHPPRQGIPKVRQVRVGKKPLRVCVPNVWLRPGTKNLHQNDESPRDLASKAENQVDNLHRRHVVTGSHHGRNPNSEGHSAAPAPLAGPSDQHGEVNFGTISSDGVSGGDGEQSKDDSQHPEREDGEINDLMQENIDFKISSIKEVGPNDRETTGNSSSLHVCPTSNQIPPTGPDSGGAIIRILREHDYAQQGSQDGIGVVDRQHHFTEREPNSSKSPRLGHVNRCSQGGIGRLGSGMSGSSNEGNLEGGRKTFEHQHVGTASSKIRLKKFSEKYRKQGDTPKDRQHNSPLLSGKDGRNSLNPHDGGDKRYLVVLKGKEFVTYPGVCALETQCDRGLAITELEGQQRMEAEHRSVQANNLGTRDPRCGPLRIPYIPLNGGVLQLDARPREHRNRCSVSELGLQPPICLPPILFDRPVPQKSTVLGDNNHFNNTNMGVPNLVPTPFGNVHKSTPSSTIAKRPIAEPQGGISPSRQKWQHEVGSLASIRAKMSTKKISDTAATLIGKSRTKGTRANYDSAWGKFSGWCSSRQIDPLSCPLDDVLNYLGDMFDKKLLYSTINGHRSAISAYHDPVDGFKVGQHPLVCSLMQGVSNERPPLPKYRYIWDVELVLKKMRDLPDNEKLPLDIMSQKLATLLGLCAVQRGSEIHGLHVKWMSESSEGYTCYFGSRVKHSVQGKVAPPVHFYPFPDNHKLCPVANINAYLKLTNPLRATEFSPLFISTKKAKNSIYHDPVVKRTVANWVLKMLDLSGIDTTKFKPHSLRSSSTSKVANEGINVGDILSMGNWSSESVWQKFYHKRVKSSGEEFQQTLLSNPKDPALKKDDTG